MRSRVQLRAHAKLNLYLSIEGRREDGFHDLVSVFHAIDLCDDVVIGPGDGITMAMEVPGTVDGPANLAARALTSVGAEGFGVEITKRIPLASGLGGGSANAAAVLLGSRDLMRSPPSEETLLRMGEDLGSDVPFFVEGDGTALVRGRGERVSLIPCPHLFWFVIGVTFSPLATADVYARWDELGEASAAPGPVTDMIDCIEAGDAAGVGMLLHNDLEAPAIDLSPELAAKKEALLESGALGALVSGSGPTVFGLASGPEHAQAIAEASMGLFDRVHVAASSPRSVERVR